MLIPEDTVVRNPGFLSIAVLIGGFLLILLVAGAKSRLTPRASTARLAMSSTCGSGDFTVTGFIRDSSGMPLSGAEVSLGNKSDNNQIVGPTSSDAQGSYELCVPPGTYTLTVKPPSGTAYTEFQEQLTVTTDLQEDVILVTSTQVSVSGFVRFGSACNSPNKPGTPVPNVHVFIYPDFSAQTNTDANGFYSLEVAAGQHYELRIGTPNFPDGYSCSSQCIPPGLPDQFEIDQSILPVGNTTIPDTIINTVTLSGNVTDSDNPPNPQAGVIVQQAFPGSQIANSGTVYKVRGKETTDSSGNFNLVLLPTIVGYLELTPPADSKFEKQAVLLNLDLRSGNFCQTAPDIQLTPQITLTGRVLNNGQGVPGLLVELYPNLNQATTDSQGGFSLNTTVPNCEADRLCAELRIGTADLLQVGQATPAPVAGLPATFELDQSFCTSGSDCPILDPNNPQLGDIKINTITLSGSVQDANKNPIPNVELDEAFPADATDTASFTPIINGKPKLCDPLDVNPENHCMRGKVRGEARTGPDGKYTMILLPSTVGVVDLSPPPGSGFLNESSNVKLSCPETSCSYNFTLHAPVTVSGRVVHNGQPVQGLRVFLYPDLKADTITGSDGSFSFTVPAGNHELHVGTPNFPSFGFESDPNLPAAFEIEYPLCLTETTNLGDIEIKTVVLTGKVEDPNQNGISGVVLAQSFFGTEITARTQALPTPTPTPTPTATPTPPQIVCEDLPVTGRVRGEASTDTDGNFAMVLLPTTLLPTPLGSLDIIPPRNSNVPAQGFNLNEAIAQDTSLTLPIILQQEGISLISGTILDSATNLPLVGVTVTLSGSPSEISTTDGNGTYQFKNLTNGRDFTVTPSRTGYQFDPINSEITNLSNDQQVNFTGTFHTFTISGRVTAADQQAGIPGVTMTLSGAQTSVITTQSDGSYAFPQVPGFVTYTVSASDPGYTLQPSPTPIATTTPTPTPTPALVTFQNLSDNQTADFIATAQPIPAPTPSLSDNFTSPTPDPSKFTLGSLTTKPAFFDPTSGEFMVGNMKVDVGISQGTNSQGIGQLTITPLAAAAAAYGSHFNGYTTARPVDLNGATAAVDIAQAANGGDTMFSVGSDENNYYRFRVTGTQDGTSTTSKSSNVLGTNPPVQIVFEVVQDGNLVVLNPPKPVPYDSGHRFVRFRNTCEASTPNTYPADVRSETGCTGQTANTIAFDTSPCPVSGSCPPGDLTTLPWVEQVRQKVNKTPVTPLALELSAGTTSPAPLTKIAPAVFDTLQVTQAPTVQFNSAAYSASQNGASVLLTVTRNGDTSQPASVDYATTDGTASERSQYIAALGTLQFPAGATTETITVLIEDIAYVEGNDTFNVTLSNPVGMTLGAIPAAVVTIVNSNTVAPTSNPIDQAQYFAAQQYLDFYGRLPDPSGLSFWTGQVNSLSGQCTQRDATARKGCILGARAQVSRAFFLSTEFQQTGYFVIRFYEESFGREPTLREFLAGAGEVGKGVVVGQTGYQQVLNQNKANFANEWITRPDFVAKYAALNNTDYINALFTNGGAASTDEQPLRAQLVKGLTSGSETRATVLPQVADSATVYDKQYNPAFVLLQYFGYLRRNASDLPDKDLSGYNFWLGKMNKFTNPGEDARDPNVALLRVTRAQMVEAFIDSTEYRKRFGPP